MSRRSSIRQRVASLMTKSNGERIVQYSLDQASRPIVLRVVVVGDPPGARAMEDRLRDELAELGEPKAAVSVWAVSDARAVSALSARLDDVPAVLPASPAEPPRPLEARIRASWPKQNGGELLSVWTSLGTPARARIAHLGPEIGAAGREMLANAVGIDTPLVIEELALVAVDIDADGVVAWLARAVALLARAREFPNVHYCITTPPLPTRRARADPRDDLARDIIQSGSTAHPNVTIANGERWRIVPQLTPCAAQLPPASP
jgi:hypothetical protein